MNRLRNDAKVSLCYEYLKDNVNAAAKILFLNIRSLHRHFSDLEQDSNLQYSDIIAETRFTDIDNSDTYVYCLVFICIAFTTLHVVCKKQSMV